MPEENLNDQNNETNNSGDDNDSVNQNNNQDIDVSDPETKALIEKMAKDLVDKQLQPIKEKLDKATMDRDWETSISWLLF